MALEKITTNSRLTNGGYTMKHEYILKGSPFKNRVRIEGVLTTKSPLHIGSGIEEPREGLKNDKNEDIKISEIAKDFSKKPFIPGSTLRGNLRSWLLQIFRSLPGAQEENADTFAWYRDFEEPHIKETFKKQDDQIKFMKEKASVLERVFGTGFSATKLDVWDANCKTDQNAFQYAVTMPPPDKPPFWIKEKLTYVTQSVAINPMTGTAIDQKLYHFEVVPKGVQFQVTLVGQNLTDLELGMIMFALEGFNSEIYAVTLGAMGSRGFGRLEFKLENLYVLHSKGVEKWLEEAMENNHAGFFGLTEMDQSRRQLYLDDFKKAFKKGLEG